MSIRLPEAPALTFRTVEVPAPVARLLDALPEEDAVAWVHGGQGLVGWGSAARLHLDPSGETTGGHLLAADTWWQQLVTRADVEDDVRIPGTGPVAFGSFAFDAALAPSVMVVPKVVLGTRDGCWWLTVADDDHAVISRASAPRPPHGVTYGVGSLDDAAWMAAVEVVVAHIRANRLKKVVLARDVVARLEDPLDVRWPLHRLAEGYSQCWTFLVDGLFGASPEPVLSLRGGVAASLVLAGTAVRGDALGMSSGAALLESDKDLKEHSYSVASVREVLRRHCVSVEVSDGPLLLHLPNVTHLASEVRGRVREGTGALQLLADLHPTAAVCGTPTAAARQLIREVEGLDRGRYAGPVGWMDAAGDGEWCIALRCAQIDPTDMQRVRLFGGGGMVRDSVPSDELAESIAKLLPVQQALSS